MGVNGYLFSVKSLIYTYAIISAISLIQIYNYSRQNDEEFKDLFDYLNVYNIKYTLATFTFTQPICYHIPFTLNMNQY